MQEAQEPPVFSIEALNALPFPLMLVDERRRVLYANRAAFDSFGGQVTQCELLCHRLVHGLGEPPPECPLDEAIAAGRAAEYTLHTEATHTWLAAGVYPTGRRTAEGLRIFLHTIQDVSEERRGREALAASEERYRTLAEAADDMVFIIDEEYRIKYVNRNAAGQFGVTPAELIGRRHSEVFPPAIAEHQSARLREVFETGLSSRSESQVAFGERSAWIDTILVPLPTHAGRPREVMGVSRDFTERKMTEQRILKAEESARASEARLNHLFDTSPTMTYSLAIEGGAVVGAWVSPNVRRILGFDPRDAMDSERWTARVHPDDVAEAGLGLPRALQTGEASHEYRLAREDGAYRWILDELRLVRDEDGEPREIVGSWLDITDRKHAEAALEESERRLQLSQRMEAVGTLAGGIAHDFNNLLTAIGGYADLLLDDPAVAEKGRTEILEIRQAADRAADLTQQLLAFSRRQTLHPVPVDINLAVSDMRRMLERIIGEDVHLSTILEPDLGFVEVDPTQLEQVILNLASNARDAMSAGGHLEFRTERASVDQEYVLTHPDAIPGEYACLTVRDTGVGMAPHVQARAFEPFFTTKPQGQGTGLGLASVYGITSQSGGHVALESEEGMGTTVRVYLPRISRPVASGPPSEPPAPSRQSGRETILLVEDEPAVLRYVARVLSESGYTVLTAANPDEAVTVARDHEGPLDLLLTDVVLPDRTGAHVAREITADRPDLRVLFMSGYARSAMVRDGRLAEGVSLLAKPFTPAELAATIRRELDRGPADAGSSVS